jgi:hypothetical protein
VSFSQSGLLPYVLPAAVEVSVLYLPFQGCPAVNAVWLLSELVQSDTSVRSVIRALKSPEPMEGQPRSRENVSGAILEQKLKQLLFVVACKSCQKMAAHYVLSALRQSKDGFY